MAYSSEHCVCGVVWTNFLLSGKIVHSEWCCHWIGLCFFCFMGWNDGRFILVFLPWHICWAIFSYFVINASFMFLLLIKCVSHWPRQPPHYQCVGRPDWLSGRLSEKTDVSLLTMWHNFVAELMWGTSGILVTRILVFTNSSLCTPVTMCRWLDPLPNTITWWWM